MINFKTGAVGLACFAAPVYVFLLLLMLLGCNKQYLFSARLLKEQEGR